MASLSKRKTATTTDLNAGAASKFARGESQKDVAAASHSHKAEPKAPKGILQGLNPSEVSEVRLKEAARQASTPQELFGAITSSSMIETIFEWFGEGMLDLEWYFTSPTSGKKEPSIVSSPHNRPLQETTVEEYQERMLKDGYHQDVAGAAWFQYQNPEKSLPVAAITFNHRREAFYRADLEAPNAPAMLSTKAAGLKQCKMLASDTPTYLIKELVKVHNLSHTGSGVNIWDLIEHALDVERQWTVHCREKGISSTNGAAYAKMYEDFLLARTDKFATWKPFEHSKALAHRLEDFKISDSFRHWCQCHMSFLDHRMNMLNTICTMHTAVNIIMTLMRRFYPKNVIGEVIFETLKLTVPSKPRGSQRVLEWCLNKSVAENGVIINLMNIPMAASATFRKIAQSKEQIQKSKAMKESKDGKEISCKKLKTENADASPLLEKLCELVAPGNQATMPKDKDVKGIEILQDESINFQDSVTSLDQEDVRPKTVLDDMLGCLSTVPFLQVDLYPLF